MSKIDDLREDLFDTIKGLKNKSMDIDRAKAIAEVAQTIINSAKVEVDYIRATESRTGTEFFPDASKVQRLKAV